MEIKDIEVKVEEVRHNLNAEYQRGAMREEWKISDLTQQLNDLTQQLEVEQRLAQHEERIEESQTEIAYILDNMTADDISMRELCQNEAAYQLLRAVVQETMMQREEKLLSEIKSFKEQMDAAKSERETTQKQYDDLYEVSAKQRNEINGLTVQLEDAEHKRDAAAAELDEARTEIKRLNSQVDDLRNEIAVGAVNATKVVDVQDALENYKKQKQKDEEAKPAIYDIKQVDLKGSEYTAKLAATGEEITFRWMEKGKYREVTAEEAETFRRAAEEQKRSDENTTQPGDGVAQDRVTPSEGIPIGLDEGNTNGEVAAKTIEERLAALEREVFGSVKGEAA